MAIWQYSLIFIPERVLLSKFEVLPLEIPMELAEDFPWWSGAQPPVGFENQIDLILPQMESWSSSMRMWGRKHGDDAHVCYVDEKMCYVEEIAFRVDARSVSTDLIRRICIFAKQLGCVLMTADYEVLAPDDSMVLIAVNQSTSKRFVDDPVSTLKNLDKTKLQKRLEYLAKENRRDSRNEE